MYSFQIILCLIFYSAVIVSSSLDVIEIDASGGKNTEEYVREVTNFWTNERLKSAIPKPMMQVDNLFENNKMNRRRKLNKPKTINGTIPASLETLTKDGYPTTAGKVFFVDEGATYSCSASVVTADNKDLIFTAAHCVFSTTTFKYVTNFAFIPQYDNGIRPHGTWPARTLYVINAWTSSLDMNYDVSIVLLNTVNNEHIQDVVGSQAVGFNHEHTGAIYSFGYPGNYNRGEIMTYCTADKEASELAGYTGDKMSCQMNQGCSGGPWFETFDTSAVTGVQTSVNSFMLRNVPNVMYGPYFGSVIESMYDAAKK